MNSFKLIYRIYRKPALQYLIWYRSAVEGKTGKTSNMAAVEADAPHCLLLSCLAQIFGDSWQRPCGKASINIDECM